MFRMQICMDLSLHLTLMICATHLMLEVLSKETSRAFYSTIKLEQLVEHEKSLINQIQLNIEKQQPNENVRPLLRYTNKIQKLTSNRSPAEIAAHPVDAFHFLRDILLEWNTMMMEIENKYINKNVLLQHLEQYRHNHSYPVEENIFEAAVVMARIHYIYEMEIEDLQQGRIVNPVNNSNVFYSFEPLNSRDCLIIGQAAMNQTWYHLGADWIKLAKQLNQNGDSSADAETIETALQEAILIHDTVLIQKGPLGPTWETHQIPVTEVHMKTRTQWLPKQTFQPKLFQWMNLLELNTHAKKICQGYKLRNPALDSLLSCRYLTNNDPYLIIAPFQYEEISQDPAIMVFRNFVSDSEIKRLKELATPHLMDSPVVFGASKGSSSRRVSQHCWVEDEANPTMMPQMARRVADATLLNNIGRDNTKQYKFKVTNYGIAGHYEVHKDFFQDRNIPNSENPFLDKRGDQIATFIIYLSDVPAGGVTVFPNVGASITPEKGSALFFYNIDKTGLPDYSTLHASCPVLYGSKWIAIKWMFQYDQDIMCGSHSLDKHPLL